MSSSPPPPKSDELAASSSTRGGGVRSHIFHPPPRLLLSAKERSDVGEEATICRIDMDLTPVPVLVSLQLHTLLGTRYSHR